MSSTSKTLTSALSVGLLCAVPAAQAFNYDINDVHISLDTKLAEGVMIRTESRDPLLIAIDHGGRAYSNNADNGDLNFDVGDITYATSSITSALKVNYGNFGIFARANYSYDPVLQNKDYYNDANFGSGHEYPQSYRLRSNRLIQDHVGSDGTILDLYAYGSTDIAGHGLYVKIGKQIVNWGESTLIFNGLNSIVSLDANKARVPGAEIDRIVIPVSQIFASLDLWSGATVEGWYQLKWQPSINDAAGTFFSTNDFTSPDSVAGNIDYGLAGEYALPGAACHDTTPGGIPVVTHACAIYGGSTPRGPDRPAKDNGQFGIALRMSIPELNDTEVALYAANYHSRLPLFSTTTATLLPPLTNSLQTSVFAEYPEDIHMYGTSFNTSLPYGFSLQGEYSFRPNLPIEIDDVEQSLADLGAPSQFSPLPGATLGGQYLRGYRRKQVSLIDLGTTKLLPPSRMLGYDDVTIIGEFAVVHVHNLEPESVLRYEAPGTFLPGAPQSAILSGLINANGQPITQQGGFATPTSWGYKLIVRATYNNLLPGLVTRPALRWDHDVGGVTPEPLGTFVRGSRMLTPSVSFQYMGNTTFEVGYTTFFGGGQSNLIRDRDNAFFDLKYEF